MKSYTTKLAMDSKFIDMAENCIASAAAGLEFGDIFESVQTVKGVSKQTLTVGTENLGAVLYTIASRIVGNDRDSLHLIGDMFRNATSFTLEENKPVKPETVF